MPQATIAEQLGDIFKAIDMVEERMPFIVDCDELGEALCLLTEITNRLVALQTKLIMQCTNNGVAVEAGQRTMGQYVAARTTSHAAEINRLARLGKWLVDFPTLAAAHGVALTTAHLEYIRTKLDTNYDNHTELRNDQQRFVDAGPTMSFAEFEQVCDYWLTIIDPDGKAPKEQLETSKLRISADGEISGKTDPVTAANLNTAIEHEAAKLRKADKAQGVERTHSARKAAALSALVERGFVRKDGTRPVPLANIVMSESVAEWALGTLRGDIEPSDTVPVDPFDIDGRCELIDGTPIHPFLAVAALGLAGPHGVASPLDLRRYVMNADSRILDVSVNARTPPEWMRTAAHVQSRGGCDTPGCDAPHHWLQMDHVQPVHHGGETMLENTQPQCEADNHVKGAKPNQTAWRDRTPPPRRRPRPRNGHATPDTDSDSDNPTL